MVPLDKNLTTKKTRDISIFADTPSFLERLKTPLNLDTGSFMKTLRFNLYIQMTLPIPTFTLMFIKRIVLSSGFSLCIQYYMYQSVLDNLDSNSQVFNNCLFWFVSKTNTFSYSCQIQSCLAVALHLNMYKRA